MFLYTDQSYLCFFGFCNCMKQHMSIQLGQWHHCLLQTAEAVVLQESAFLPRHGPLCTVLAAPHLPITSTKVITSGQGRRSTEDGSSRFTQNVGNSLQDYMPSHPTTELRKGCLYGLVLRVPGYRSRGPGSIPSANQIF
jgi:hypothetical protein